MALDDLKDKIKEQAAETWSRIESSPLYNNLKEKFETQSPGVQKAIVSGVAIFIALILLSFPISDINSSSTSIEDYDSSRSLLRSLLRASRLASEASSVPPPFSVADLKAQVQSQLGSFALKPEQVGGVIDLDINSLGTPLAPKTINQSGIGVSLKKLNLKQVVDIGFEFQKLNASVKIAGMEIAAGTPDPHYFDVLYKLIIFTMPENKSNETSRNSKSGSPRSRLGSDRGDGQ
ncbi:MAG: hypothetical protein KDD38_01110 [Bdellovibrionales bacterium]|nr:hypothetical protein [Bdellovibrionales bacterium]